jgi:hypothetical protein
MRILIALLLLLPLAGCMHTTRLAPETPSDSLAQINRRIAGRSGFARLQNDEVVAGKQFVVDRELTRWTIPRTDSIWVMPTRDLKHIIVQDRKQGIRDGLIYGPLVGAAVGTTLAIIAFMLTPEPRSVPDDEETGGQPFHYDSCESPSFPQYVGYGVVSGAAAGLCVGLLLGGGVGSLIKVQFVPSYRW